VTFRGRCALVALPACSGHQGFYVGNEGLHVGCTPNGPAKYFWILGRYTLETILRSTCLEWLRQTPYSHAGYLGVSTLHTFEINIILPASSLISKTIEDLFMRCTFQDPARYTQILDIIDLTPLRGRHAYKASLRSALPDSLQLC
jgi:hypothetical protein